MEIIQLNQNDAKLLFDAKSGKYTIVSSTFVLPDCKPLLKINEKTVPFGIWKKEKESENSIQFHADGKYGKWDLTFTIKTNDGISVHLTGKLNKTYHSVDVFYFSNAEVPADHVLVQANSMGECSAYILKNKEKSQSFDCAIQLLITKDGRQLQLSNPVVCDHVTHFTGKTGFGKVQKLNAGISLRHFLSKEINLEPMTIRSGDGFQLMREYGEENVTEKKDFSELTVAGWNSWDYYRWTVTEEEVLENARFIASDPVLSKYVKRIIIDDGWQYAYGEWEANSYFPHGMEWLAKQIKSLGFQPGIWIAPTIVEPHSRIAQMEPDMLARCEADIPALSFNCMKRNQFILDPTVEKSQKFIYDLFSRYADYGYEYFKLDFLAATNNARQFQDKMVPRGKLMDITIGLARKATEGRAKILGCNYMYSGGMPWVDAVRIGGDIHARWDSIKENTPSIAARFWANNKLWLNDPDFSLCRGFDTSDDPALTQMRCSIVFVTPDNLNRHHPGWEFTLVDMKRAQAEVLLSLVIASGGARNLSDKITRLNESGLDLARRTVAAEYGEAAIPLDLFSTKLPCYWIQKLKNGYRILLINWDDQENVFTFDLNKYDIHSDHIVNFWNDECINAPNGIIQQKLSPRSCLFLEIR